MISNPATNSAPGAQGLTLSRAVESMLQPAVEVTHTASTPPTDRTLLVEDALSGPRLASSSAWILPLPELCMGGTYERKDCGWCRVERAIRSISRRAA